MPQIIAMGETSVTEIDKEMDAHSELEWIQQIGKIAGWNNEIIKLHHDKLPVHLQELRLAWTQNLTLDTHLIRDELNYKELYSSNNSMKKSIDWLRTHNPEQTDINSFDYDAEDKSIISFRS